MPKITTNNKRGGERPGAGRKNKSGIPGQKSIVLRIPEIDKDNVLNLLKYNKEKRVNFKNLNLLGSAEQNPTSYAIPKFATYIRAGFPSPADDYIEKTIDLNKLLIKNPISTFFLEGVGDSMIDAGIYEGDKLIVDKSIEPKHNDIVIALIDSEYTVKRLYKKNRLIKLIAANDKYQDITLKIGQELNVFGVVTSVIRKT